MRPNSPRRKSGFGLSQIATLMMVAAALAAIVFVGVIGYVLIVERGPRAADSVTTTPSGAPSSDLASPTEAGPATFPALSAEQTHVVTPGETLIGIAAAYNVPVDVLKQVNHLADPATIYPGQQLIIPASLALTPTASLVTLAPTLPPTLSPDDPANLALISGWPRSLSGGSEEELRGNYPQLLLRPRFTLRYQPGTYPDLYINDLVALVEAALADVEARLGVQLDGSFDVYAAGTLFVGDDINIRGLSRSKDRKVFILFDGTGDPVERAYAITHEIAHVVAWNTWGTPSSTMLSEGLATATGQIELESGGFIPYDQLCLGLAAADQMESMAVIDRDPKKFQGHIENRFNYFSAACFVRYLIDSYGLEAMSQLYHTSSYPELYGGRSLEALDAEWQASLKTRSGDLVIDPAALVEMNRRVNNAYDTIFSNYNGTPQMHQAYIAVDKARIALWRGDYEAADRWLAETYRLSGFQQP